MAARLWIDWNTSGVPINTTKPQTDHTRGPPESKPDAVHCPLVVGCSKAINPFIRIFKAAQTCAHFCHQLKRFVSSHEAWLNMTELFFPGSVSRFQGCKLRLQMTSPMPDGTSVHGGEKVTKVFQTGLAGLHANFSGYKVEQAEITSVYFLLIILSYDCKCSFLSLWVCSYHILFLTLQTCVAVSG